jgi:tetratricopeptide (TPR) repeat protein
LTGAAVAAALAGALFAVHPVHLEAVAWISARNELLLGVFLLGSFLAYLHARRGAGSLAWAACFALFALALLSKETAVLFPGIVLLHEWTARPADAPRSRGKALPAARGDRGASSPSALRRQYRGGLALAALAGAFLVVRAALVTPLPAHDPLATRLATAPGLVLANLRLLFVPIGLRVLHGFEPVTSPLSGAAWLPAAVLIAALPLLPRAFRFDPVLGFGLGWILLALVPVSGLPALLQPTPLAERYLYLPSVGWALVVASLLARAGRAGLVVALIAIPAFAAIALAHLPPWRSDLTLATRMCEDAPRSALAHSSLGLATYRLGRWEEGAREFAIAAELRPADPWNHYYLGCSERRLGRLAPAEAALRKALGLGMRFAPAHLELCEVLEQDRRLSGAEAECRAAIALDSTLVEAHAVLGRVLYAAGRYAEAERSYRAALALRPEDARTRSNLGGLYMALARWDDAIAELERACRDDPGLAEAHFNRGSALFARHRLPEAEGALRAGLALQPGAADERIMLGRVLLAEGRALDAAREARAALAAAPADSAVQHAGARVLAEAERHR